ncbi:MAG: dihydrofolate reductase [Mariprofundales bacterium]|nr:dihydrofolate reductase [Mariprofundales bacterium]
MTISLIWAMDRNRLIGDHGMLPWPHIAADMRWFRQQTEGKSIIMGRTTFESIGRALPKRRNIVLSRQELDITGVELLHTIDAVLSMERQQPESELMVIGGALLYGEMLAHADRLIYTEIAAEFRGDRWFPPVDSREWHTTHQEQHPAGSDSPYPLTFTIANREPVPTDGSGD